MFEKKKSSGSSPGTFRASSGNRLAEPLDQLAHEPIEKRDQAYLILALVVTFLWLTWPVGTTLVATTAAWWLVRKREDWWGKASASILASTSFGVGTVCVLLLVFNAFKRILEPQWLYDLESSLVTLRIWVQDKTSPTLPTFVVLVTGLVVMSYLLPRLKPVSRFFVVKSAISKIVVALTAATSFSFFSQVPLEHFAVEFPERLASNYRSRIAKYHALLRQELDEVGRYLAATALEQRLGELDSADQAAYRELFSQTAQLSWRQEIKFTLAEHGDGSCRISIMCIDYINTIWPDWQRWELSNNSKLNLEKCDALIQRCDALVQRIWDEIGSLNPSAFSRAAEETIEYTIGSRVAARLAARHYEAAMGNRTAENGSVDSWIGRKLHTMKTAAAEIQRRPTTLDDWARYKGLVAAQERDCTEQKKATERATVRADERVLGLKKIFAEFVGHGVPAVDGVAGEYIKELAKKFSEYVAGEVVRSSAREPAKESPDDLANEFAKATGITRLQVIARARMIDSQVLESAGATGVLPQKTIVMIRNEVQSEVKRVVDEVTQEREVARRQTELTREVERPETRKKPLPGKPRGK